MQTYTLLATLFVSAFILTVLFTCLSWFRNADEKEESILKQNHGKKVVTRFDKELCELGVKRAFDHNVRAHCKRNDLDLQPFVAGLEAAIDLEDLIGRSFIWAATLEGEILWGRVAGIRIEGGIR